MDSFGLYKHNNVIDIDGVRISRRVYNTHTLAVFEFHTPSIKIEIKGMYLLRPRLLDLWSRGVFNVYIILRLFNIYNKFYADTCILRIYYSHLFHYL